MPQFGNPETQIDNPVDNFEHVCGQTGAQRTHLPVRILPLKPQFSWLGPKVDL
jgi:hypothetical protein